MADGQRDIDGARELIEQLLQEKARQFAVPLLDESGNLTGESFDIRLGQREQQPQPKRLLEHLEFLRQQGTPAVPGQPVPGFEVTDPFESEGFLDSVSNVFKLATERSLTGVAFEAATGGKLVDTEGFQPSKLEDISANVLSFFSPLDLVALIGGGGVGGLAVKTLAKKAIQKGLAKGLTRKAASKAAGKSLLQIIPRSAGSIGLHTAATQTLQEKLDTGEMSLETFMEGLAKGGLLGAIVGGAGGTAGLLTQTLPKTAQVAIGLTAEVASLGAASPFVFEDRAPTLADFQHAAEFIVGLKLVGGAARGAGAAFSKLKGENPAQAETRVKAETKKLKTETKKTGDFNEAVTKSMGAGEALIKGEIDRAFKGRISKADKEKFLKTTGKKVVQRRLDKGETVKLSRSQAEKTLGDEVLKGKRPENVTIVQVGKTKAVLHEIKKNGKSKLNILSVDSFEAFQKAQEAAKKRGLPLSISTGVNKLLLKNLESKGLIDAPKAGLKFVKVKPPVEKPLTRESFRTQMAKAVPKASGEQIDATMAIIDARAKVAGQTTDAYLKQRFPAEAVKVGETGQKQRFAQVQFVEDGKAVITAFQKADIGSMVHELGHVFRRDLSGKDLAIAAQWAGGKGTRWSVKADEKFANGFESYLRDGKAPNATLKTVFEKFKVWLTEIFSKFKTQKINPEIRGVFDRLLSSEAESGLRKIAKVAPNKPITGQLSTAEFKKQMLVELDKLKTEQLETGRTGFKEPPFFEGLIEEATLNVGGTEFKLRSGADITELKRLTKGFRDFVSPTGRVPNVKTTGKALEAALKSGEVTKTLFQERQAVKTFGGELKKFYDKTTQIMAPLSRAQKRVNRIESKTLIRGVSEARFLEGQFNLENFKISEDLGFFNLTEAQRKAMPDRLRAGEEPGYRKLYTDIWNNHIKLGGKGRFRKNYVPDMVIREEWADLSRGLQTLRLRLGDPETLTEARIRSAINSSPDIVKDNLNHILETGQIKTAKAALSGIKFDKNKRALDVLIETENFRSIADALKSLKPKNDGEFLMEPFWTKEKKLNLLPEMYETDFAKIHSAYILSSSKKRAELQVFGGDNGKGIKTLARLEKIDPEEGKIMREVLSKWSGQYDVDHGLTGAVRTLADGVMGFEVITKIASGFATTLNVTQMFIGAGQLAGFWNLAKGAVKMLEPRERAVVRESGVFVNKASSEAYLASVGYEGGGRWAQWATFATKWSGFTGINRINNYLAASSIREALPGMLRTANGIGKRAVAMRRSLADLGVDYRKSLTTETTNRAMFHFTRRTQLLKDVVNEPLFLTTPALRPFLLFKRFGIQQFLLQKDILQKEVLRGNYMPFVRLAVGGYLGGAGMIWAQGQIKSLLAGEPYFRKDDGFVNEVVENIAIIGMFGVVGDMAAIDRLSSVGSKIRFAVEPVVVSDANKIFEAFNRWTKDWDRYGDGWLATKRNAYHIFDIFGSLPRLAAKRLRTPIQVERGVSLQKGRERREIMEAIIGGNGARAANRTFEWNRNHPENPITMDDVNMSAIRKFLEGFAETRAGVAGGKKSKEFRKAFREEKRKIRKEVSLTRAERIEFRKKLLLLRRKFNTSLSNRKAG